MCCQLFSVEKKETWHWCEALYYDYEICMHQAIKEILKLRFLFYYIITYDLSDLCRNVIQALNCSPPTDWCQANPWAGPPLDNLPHNFVAEHTVWQGTIRVSGPVNMKGRFYLTNLISLCETVTPLMDEGRAVDTVYLDFIKSFVTVSHSILLEKLASHGLDIHFVV